MLCSISWQRPVPKIHVHGEPDSQRCFETEQTRLTVWVTEEAGASGASAVELTVAAVEGMQLEVLDPDTRHAKTVAAAAQRWGRYPVRARVDVDRARWVAGGNGHRRRRRCPRVSVDAAAVDSDPATELLDRLGTHLTRHIGPGVEYADIRAYVPGDQLRTVNWPVSARRGQLHVTERLTDRAADVVVLIDGYPQPAGPATDATERIVRGAAQVVQTRAAHGDRAGIVALGGNRPRWLGADIGQRQFYRVLDAVLGAGEDSKTRTGTLAPRAAVPARAIVIAFSTLLDTEFALALIDLRRRGHVVLAVDVLESSPFRRRAGPTGGSDVGAAALCHVSRHGHHRRRHCFLARGSQLGPVDGCAARPPPPSAGTAPGVAVTRAVSTAFGLLMVGLVAVGSHGPAAAAGVVTLIAVGVGIVFRPAATVAVLLAVATIVLSDSPPVLTALSGLCAAAHLVCRYAAGTSTSVVLGSWPTVVAAGGFTFAGIVATSFPLQLPWLPLAAPLGALAIYVLATRPFLGSD